MCKVWIKNNLKQYYISSFVVRLNSRINLLVMVWGDRKGGQDVDDLWRRVLVQLALLEARPEDERESDVLGVASGQDVLRGGGGGVVGGQVHEEFVALTHAQKRERDVGVLQLRTEWMHELQDRRRTRTRKKRGNVNQEDLVSFIRLHIRNSTIQKPHCRRLTTEDCPRKYRWEMKDTNKEGFKRLK